MCGMGIIIFLNFPMQDFLTPGFVQKGIILESFEMKGDSSYDGTMHVDKIGTPYVLALSDNGSPTKFDVRIEGMQGEVYHDEIFEKGQVRFTPDVTGDYSIHIKNQSVNPSSVTVIYGLPVEYDQTALLMTAIWVLLIIGGNYLILHKHFTRISN